MTNIRSRGNFKNLYVHFAMLTATKLGKMSISGRSISTQTLKSSTTSCFFSPFLWRRGFRIDLKKKIKSFPTVVLVDTCDQDRSTSLETPSNYSVYVMKLRVCEHDMLCALEINGNDRFEQGHVESCLIFRSLKTYLHYHNVYGHQTWQDDLP